MRQKRLDSPASRAKLKPMASNSNTLQDGQPAQLQPVSATIQPKKPRKSYKSPATKAAVIAKRIDGQPKIQIARDLGLARMTVDAIIEESDIDKLMEDGQLQAFRRIPAALKTLDARLEKNSENAALWLLDKCFEPSKIGPKQPNTQLVVAIQNLMQPTSNSGQADNSAAITAQVLQPTDNTTDNK